MAARFPRVVVEAGWELREWYDRYTWNELLGRVLRAVDGFVSEAAHAACMHLPDEAYYRCRERAEEEIRRSIRIEVDEPEPGEEEQ